MTKEEHIQMLQEQIKCLQAIEERDIGGLVMVRDHLNDEWKGPYALEAFERKHNFPFQASRVMWRFARPAKQTRVLIRDKKRLVQILLDEGYLPDDDGDFVNPKEPNNFVTSMWKCLGEEVRKDSSGLFRTVDKFWCVKESWTELIEDEV